MKITAIQVVAVFATGVNSLAIPQPKLDVAGIQPADFDPFSPYRSKAEFRPKNVKGFPVSAKMKPTMFCTPTYSLTQGYVEASESDYHLKLDSKQASSGEVAVLDKKSKKKKTEWGLEECILGGWC